MRGGVEVISLKRGECIGREREECESAYESAEEGVQSRKEEGTNKQMGGSRVREGIQNNSEGCTVKKSVWDTVLQFSVCQCMCLIGFLACIKNPCKA